jgi:hypothetical protein
MSRLIEGHEQPLSLIESDMIDNLTQSIAFILFYWSEEAFEWRSGEG